MADEQQAQVEETTQDESLNQSEVIEETNGSEAEETQVQDTKKGDPWIAMHQEREARQRLEQSLNDPDFIIQRAKALGLTEDDGSSVEQNTQKAQPYVQPKSGGIEEYKYYRELEKSQEKYPALNTEPDDQIAVTALMTNLGLSPLQAADRYYGKFNKAQQAAKVEGAKEKEQTISAKEQAQTVATTVNVDSDAAEVERLTEASKDWRNPKKQEEAMLELLKKRI